ncbi:MOSC domain-containing protein [Pseudomonas sp. FW306-02-F02-AA]|uniref:Molybdenum cofactor sulfurase n=1 Tax=Pseudomonas fluorescens TaxID=294 RepID=A0A0N9WY48_PSEFL|nr:MULTISPECIES: MOSC domain-containing protein [Pseudomonas]ALI03123.1 molybdenum cofactor sulfurase [Pseudomonas fluorescens]PMZ00989.1 MOSC domain-containing protein [Pseudomonas sp. FW306-02-F02-AB]PMZ06819.1 MOSC domain-containing protein [Pseudomonas sp. FW306-02-H06C]PMZ12786.1 MOSC domain-containing protein [Pseudomonas sp. FW306-02-F02-AA]PMZ18676.1 MOSC domain-containing protein [Pseudomonas sp. FW306-02-F08-AA]
MLRLSALYRYPLKSGKGEILQQASLDKLGLEGDRRWMLVDEASGRFLTQRVESGMSQLSALWNTSGGLTLSAPGRSSIDIALPASDAELRGVTIWRDTLRVPDAGEAAGAWVSEFIGKPTRLVQVPEALARTTQAGYGKEDDKVAFADGFPLLLIGQASLEDLSQRVGRPLEMLRFRPNLVIEGSEAFAEDGWKRIRIGDVEFRVVKPCSRCILTTIDPQTGERSDDREPLATLQKYRAQEDGAMFGQNLVNDGNGRLEVGMPVEILE